MGTLFQDLRLAVRLLGKHPAFACAAVVTLTLGIGASSAIFSVVNGVLLEALPYRDSSRLVTLTGGDVDGTFGVSQLERLAYREEATIFEGVATYTTGTVNLTGRESAERLTAAFVDAGVLPVLGASPALGRAFSPDEDVAGRDDVAILSHQLWLRAFGGRSEVLGEPLILNGSAATVIGVAPPDFRLPTGFTQRRADIYLPLALPATPDPRNLHYMEGLARLREGVGLAQARARLAELGESLRSEISTLPASFSPVIEPVRDTVLGDVRPALWILLGAVTLVLVIAAVNVASLFLARSEDRLLELSVRSALGAGRGRILRQLLTEAALMAAIAGGLGLALAHLTVRALIRLSPPNLPRLDEVGLDARVVLFTASASLLAALIFGVAPAVGLGDTELQRALREGSRSGSRGARRRFLRHGLVVGEMALAVMLAIGGGLLMRSFVRLQAVDSGFNPQDVLTVNLSLPSARYPDKLAARRFYQDLLGRLRQLPGVDSVGATRNLPLANNTGDWGIRIEGREEERLASGRRPWGDWIVVTDGYFRTMGIELRAGRLLGPLDVAEATPVVVVNDELARRYFPDGSAVGRRFRMSADIDTVYRTIVGVVASVKHRGLDGETRPEFYLPHAQFPASQDFAVGAMTMVIKTAGAPLALGDSVRRVVRAIDPALPLSEMQSMAQVVDRSTSVRRLNVLVFGAFGILGLALVAVGVYGVMAYSVTQRTRELGIRVALGAAPSVIRRLVVGHAMTLALVGVVVGLGGALAFGRVLEGLLFEVGSRDLATFLAIPALLILTALVACYLPARRAARIDPMAALRAE